MHRTIAERPVRAGLMSALLAMMAALFLLFSIPLTASGSNTWPEHVPSSAGTVSADLAPQAFLLPHQGHVSAPQPDERPHHRHRAPFLSPTLGTSICGPATAAGSTSDTPPATGLGLIGTEIIYPFHGFW